MLKTALEKIKGLRSLVKMPQSKVFYKRKGIRPHKHWQIIVVTISVILLIEMAFSAYLYIGIKGGKIFAGEEGLGVSRTSLNNSLLKKISDEAKARQESFDNAEERSLTNLDPAK